MTQPRELNRDKKQRYISPFVCPPILMYHLVDDDIDSSVAISRDAFHEQIDILASAGFKTLLPSELTRLGTDFVNSPLRSVVLTFDDAYTDFLDVAMPVLDVYGFRAAVFVITDAVGRDNSWNRKAPYWRHHMDWNQLSTVVDAGHEVGSHGCTHHSLLKLSNDDVLSEARRSRALLEEKLATTIGAFAYPYGDVDSRIAPVVSQVYPVSFSVTLVADLSVRHAGVLPRIPITRRHYAELFRCAAASNLWCLAGHIPRVAQSRKHSQQESRGNEP